jgi:predicted nucleic acid-binding protein
MKALLDTNIIIHREAGRVQNTDIGVLYKYLEKARYEKVIHPATIEEIKKNPNKATVEAFLAKMGNYTEILSPAPLNSEVATACQGIDQNENDRLDTLLINEVFSDRVEILITEDKKMHSKARLLGIDNRVFTIESFLEKITSEYPELINYKVLSVKPTLFGSIDISDSFFDSFKIDYPGFEKWFNKKANERAYITYNTTNKKILSFLYLKREDQNEVYSDIIPIFSPKRRLKIGTFKVVSNGLRLGERFLKIIFDNALANKIEEIYVTIFDRTEDQKRLIELLENWGFRYWGRKKENELVYVRDFSKIYDTQNPRFSYPYVARSARFFLVPIYPEYHTELFPDSILRTESPLSFVDSEPHRNAISKIYVSRSIVRNIQKGDVLIFYRTGGIHQGVISTICLAEETILKFKDEEDFIRACRKRSVFSEQALRNQWRYKKDSKPFVVSMLYVYSFPKRANLKTLIDNNIIKGIEDVPRGFQQITAEKFETILKLTETDQSFIVS